MMKKYRTNPVFTTVVGMLIVIGLLSGLAQETAFAASTEQTVKIMRFKTGNN